MGVGGQQVECVECGRAACTGYENVKSTSVERLRKSRDWDLRTRVQELGE